MTSIDNQLGALCHQCVTTLMEVLAGKSSPTRTVFSAVLVERESTALKRGGLEPWLLLWMKTFAQNACGAQAVLRLRIANAHHRLPLPFEPSQEIYRKPRL